LGHPATSANRGTIRRANHYDIKGISAIQRSIGKGRKYGGGSAYVNMWRNASNILGHPATSANRGTIRRANHYDIKGISAIQRSIGKKKGSLGWIDKYVKK